VKWTIFLFPVIAYAGLQDGRLTILSVKGTSSVSAGQSLPPGTITTGEASGCEVFLSNGTKIILNADCITHFKTLKQMEGQQLQPDAQGTPTKELGPSVTEIEVEKGKVVGDVKKLDKQSSFTLKTPVGTVRIKGTVFSVEYVVNKDGVASFNVGCARGLVQVEMPNGTPVAIKPGQQLSVSAAPGSPGQPAPPPQMKVEPLKAGVIPPMPGLPNPTQPPPPEVGKPLSPEDKVIQNIENTIDKQQVNPSPTGG
jgi:hypothetical protein